jgi:REP element-mobilizing transposase RayT
VTTYAPVALLSHKASCPRVSTAHRALENWLGRRIQPGSESNILTNNIELIYTIMRHMNEQLELHLVRHGGRRPGAGRKPGPNPRIRHRSRERFGRLVPAHVTIRVRGDVPSLRTVKLVQEMERSFARVCEREDFRLVHYSLQGNHSHLIIEAESRDALGRGMKALGSRLARAVNRVFRHSGPVLADRYHVRMLRTPREVRNAIAYVLLNARRHAARAGRTLSRAFRIDPASSGRWFDGWKRNPGLAPDQPAVSRPHSWLLTVGWRRHALLDPHEIPGEVGLQRVSAMGELRCAPNPG